MAKVTEQQVAEDGQATEYPPYSMNYYLHVDYFDGSGVEWPIWINVNPAPVNAPDIEYISATPPEIILTLCSRIDWSVKGQVDKVNLLVDNVMRLDGTAMIGNYEDCPPTAGPHFYTLQAFGPGGSDTMQTTVNVRGAPVTEAPVTEVPTEPPVIPTEPLVTVAPTEPP
jgi:hypothetical protein